MPTSLYTFTQTPDNNKYFFSLGSRNECQYHSLTTPHTVMECTLMQRLNPVAFFHAIIKNPRGVYMFNNIQDRSTIPLVCKWQVSSVVVHNRLVVELTSLQEHCQPHKGAIHYQPTLIQQHRSEVSLSLCAFSCRV